MKNAVVVVENIQVCNLFMNRGTNLNITEFIFSSGLDSLKDTSYTLTERCIHYYACIWAVASDIKLYNEFSHLIQKEMSLCK